MLPTRPASGAGTPGGTLTGAGLVATGLCLGLLTLAAPLGSRLAAGGLSDPGRLPLAGIVWWLGLIAGAALLVAGAERLAPAIAVVRARGTARQGRLAAPSAGSANCVAVDGVVPHDGRVIDTVVVGPFGAAVLHELPSRDRLRRIDDAWQERTANGWSLAEHPVDRAARDAERVRHWLAHGELDFVVRVYAALVTTDPTIPRSPLCAVVGPEQLPAWLAGLPRQRTLTEGRRRRLVARVRDGASRLTH